MRGSFWRSEPAAALRGLAKIRLSVISSLSFSKLLVDMYISPRTSTFSGMKSPRNFCGILRTVLILGVQSSPTRPSPREAPTTSLPLL